MQCFFINQCWAEGVQWVVFLVENNYLYNVGEALRLYLFMYIQ